MTATKKILVIGATGPTGKAVLRELTKQNTALEVHIMARNPDRLASDKQDNFHLQSITKGDARNAGDIEYALEVSRAEWVFICVGNGQDTSKTDIRGSNATATVSVLQKPRFRHVRAMVVSSYGAGPTKVKFGMGVGMFLSVILRHVFADHTNEEAAFQALRNRLTIVRPTSLTEGNPTGKLVTFGNTEKCPAMTTDRADLAAWIVNEMCGAPTLPRGGAVNVTCAKK